MGICLDLYTARAAVGKPLVLDLPFPRRLLLVMLEAARSVARATENLIGCVEGAPTLDLRGP